jgi:hypothetical protein
VSIYEAGGVLQRFAQDFLSIGAGGLEMTHKPQIKIPATYMRGGTSKGVFFRLQDLPEAAQQPGAAPAAAARDRQPDPYGKQIDGMGGATSSTSKTVILAKSTRPITTSTTCSARSPSTRLSSTGAATAATCPPPSARSPSAVVWLIQPVCRATAWPWCASGKPTSARPSSPTSR